MPCDTKGGYCPTSSSPDITIEDGCDEYSLQEYFDIPWKDTLGCGGSQTKYEPCPPGYYCPFNDSTGFVGSKIECPEGKYCYGGVTQPSPCLFFYHCEKGSKAPEASEVVYFFISLIFFLGLAIIWPQN